MGDGGGVTVVESREWYLAACAPENVPTSDHLKLRTVSVSLEYESIPDQQVALELLLISVDPYLRSQITGRNDDLCLPQVSINKVITGFGIGRVVRSKSNNFSEGDIVINPFFPIAEYCISPSDFLRKIDPTSGIALPDYLSCLGIPGFTAWVGIEVIGNPNPGSNVFISAAAGGVGMFAGQLAKLKGCRVVGSTGSDEKVQVLKDKFGYDDAFNYHKESNFDVALAKYFPSGIDLYLDNVGGKMLEAVLNHVNKGARIPISGMMSQYNKGSNARVFIFFPSQTPAASTCKRHPPTTPPAPPPRQQHYSPPPTFASADIYTAAPPLHRLLSPSPPTYFFFPSPRLTPFPFTRMKHGEINLKDEAWGGKSVESPVLLLATISRCASTSISNNRKKSNK